MQTLKKFEFAGARENSYDWPKLLDGGIYQLEEGKDYQCKQTTFATLARNAAKKANKSVRIQKVEGGTVIQAIERKAEADGDGKPAAKAPKAGGKGKGKAAPKPAPVVAAPAEAPVG